MYVFKQVSELIPLELPCSVLTIWTFFVLLGKLERVPLCAFLQQLEEEEHPYSISVTARYASECEEENKGSTAKGIWIPETGTERLIQ